MQHVDAIEDNLAALKRIVEGLVGMAGLTSGALPRCLHRAVLRLLRPAESAARRLIIAAARGIVVQLNPGKARPEPAAELRRLGLLVSPARGFAEQNKSTDRKTPPRQRLALPLLDPPYRPLRRRRTVPEYRMPRIMSFDGSPFRALPPPPPPPAPDDPLDATRLRLRLSALVRALDDLPGQALRFARWQARVERANSSAEPNAKPRREWPLRFGRPYGCRMDPYDLDTRPRRDVREIDEILAYAHALASEALRKPAPS